MAVFFFALSSVLIPGGDILLAHADDATANNPAISSSTLQAQVANNDAQIAALNAQIAEYKAQLQQVGADKKTLQAAINALDLRRKSVEAQVALTEAQIGTTQIQIQQLSGKITDTKQAIANNQAALGVYLRELQKDNDKPLLLQLLSSNNLSQMWSDVAAMLEIQNAVRKNMQALQSQKDTLANSKTASEQKQATLASQKTQLASQQESLAASAQAKDQLLAETNAKESNYQKLLAAAEAELGSFATFTQNAGGSKLLSNQTSCDAWGCYYNQRDTAWGADPLDGTKYTLASAGCLIASVAMVLTHYGYNDVTPATINANQDNFAAYAPDLLLASITVGNVTATRKSTNVRGSTAARKVAVIDAALAAGHPAIVGMDALGGTHFVVLTSGSNGNYLMRDPYVAGGKDISFSSKYSLKEIYSVAKVVISG